MTSTSIELESPLLAEASSVPETKGTNIIIGILGVLNLGLIGVLIPTVIYARDAWNTTKDPIPSPLDYLIAQFEASLPETFLPARYVANSTYWASTTDQASRGTCWAWATIYLLQSQYRAQGIRYGFLHPDEHVNLSVQAYVSLVGNWCRSHPTEKVCGYGGFLKNTTNDGQVELFPEFVKTVPNLNLSIVPDSVCPYALTTNQQTDFQCDNLSDALQNNPIGFSIKSFRTAYDLRGVKQLLYTAQRPIGIGTPTGSVNYYVPCDNSPYWNETACRQHYYPCPTTQDGTFCHILKIGGYSSEGVFLTVDEIERIQQSGGHAMNIIGYNDEWRYNNRFALPKSVANLKGAFVLHNSWGSRGHSIEFLMGQRTLENEEATCPNHRDPLNWIPGSLADLLTAKGNHTLVSTDLKRIRRHGRTKHADLLQCTDSTNLTCTRSHFYVLGRAGGDANTTALPHGLYRTQFIDVTDPANITSVDIAYPFWGLTKIFAPQDLVENDFHNCGFYAFPYQTMEALRRRNWDLFDNFKASDIEFEFANASYARAHESAGKDLRYLGWSTYSIPPVAFDGPIPFDLIYDAL